MSKKYVFNDRTYTNLNDLGLAYSTNYSLAILDVKNNYKELFKFIKSCRKSMYKEALDIFYTSKYTTTVVTRFIHLFTYENIVCINDKVLKFEDFTRRYLDNKELYSSFIKDRGLEKTFGLDPKHPNLKKNVITIRRNVDDEFIDLYISNYFRYDGLEDLTPYLTFNSDKELFLKYNELFKQPDVQLILSQKYGLENILKLRNEEDYPIFCGLKLVCEYFSDEEIISIINSSHNMWLLANFDKYTYKSKAKRTYKKLNDIKKTYIKALKNKGINKILDIASMAADVYLEFVNNFSKKLIKVRKNESAELYDINIKYCDTYVAKNYLFEARVEDFNENEDEVSTLETKKVNIIEFPVKKERKRIYKLNRYKGGLVFFDILAILFLIGVIVTELLSLELFRLPLSDATLDIVYIALLFVILIFAIIISVKTNKIRKSFNKVARLRTLYTGTIEMDDLDNEIAKLEIHDKKNVKRAKRSARITTALTCAMLAFVYGVIAISVFNSFLSDLLNEYIDWSSMYETNSSAAIFLMFGPALAFLYGLLRKKKGFFTNVFVIILAIIGVILPVFIF